MTICLNMIVRDEAHVIEKTLKNICSVFPITYWVISDTGSTDNTPEIIKKTFQELKIPGELTKDTWVNFAHNRNRALKNCSGKSDYVLFFDADDWIEGTPALPVLSADLYSLKMENEGRTRRYSRPLLVRNCGELLWRGVVHEFIELPGGKRKTLEGEYAIISGRTGARSIDPEKYKKDALLLERAIQSGDDPDLTPRYAYYCANSWRDHGDAERALKWYVTRTKLSGWKDETYMAFLEAGLHLERIHRADLALDFFLRGYDLVPDRAECLYHATRSLRHRGQFRAALILAKEAVCIPKPSGNRLFISDAIYDYWLAYELLFLTGKEGGNPRDLPCYEGFMASEAPKSSKDTLVQFT